MRTRINFSVIGATQNATSQVTSNRIFSYDEVKIAKLGDVYPPLFRSVEYFAIGGGGGGVSTSDAGGGGAAGDAYSGTLNVTPGMSFSIGIGGGGAVDANGTSTTIGTSVTALGGGKGTSTAEFGYDRVGGNNTLYTGGYNYYWSGSSSRGGGGAGAGGNGNSAVDNGNGGPGVFSSLSGSSVQYGGGGGASAEGGGGSSGGAGGGGNGGQWASSGGGNGTTNTGSGGGAGSSITGGSGGSGLVILRYSNVYADAAATTGSPTYSNSGGYKIYTWTGNGSITF